METGHDFINRLLMNKYVYVELFWIAEPSCLEIVLYQLISFLMRFIEHVSFSRSPIGVINLWDSK